MIKKLYHFFFRRYLKATGAGLLLLLLLYLFRLPRPLFDAPYCLVLESREGALLGARIAEDGQWRFPEIDSVPKKFERCLLEFEDQRFHWHPGVDPIGLARALWQNLQEGKIVSGGSTLSMQVIRMSLGNPPRTLLRKAQEIVMATRLELGYRKTDILQLYASHAPFGGNVVGLEAASWRYFGKHPQLLSWAESAMLAVLPNQPGLIHPGRNRKALKLKRNRLLRRLNEQRVLDKLDLQLALEEPLPEAPHPLPQLAPHLMGRIEQERTSGDGGRIKTSLQQGLQQQATAILSHHQQRLSLSERELELDLSFITNSQLITLRIITSENEYNGLVTVIK